MKQNIKDIIKYKFYKKIELKKELKKKILKSIIQNKFIEQKYRNFAQFRLNCLNKNIRFNRNKQICFLTGHKRGLFKKINLSRQQVKQKNILGKIQNIKLKSW